MSLSFCVHVCRCCFQSDNRCALPVQVSVQKWNTKWCCIISRSQMETCTLIGNIYFMREFDDKGITTEQKQQQLNLWIFTLLLFGEPNQDVLFKNVVLFFFIPARMNEKNPANSCSPIFRLTINLLDQKCWWVCVGCKIEWISILYSAGITFYAIMRTQRIHNSKRAVSRIPSRRCVVAVY